MKLNNDLISFDEGKRKTSKRKLNPKIIRRGDLVKVENCMFFVRCGYPLCLKDLTSEILEKRKKEIYDLIRSEFPPTVRKYFIVDSLAGCGSVPLDSISSDQDYKEYEELAEQIARKMAQVKIVEKRYGGSSRDIYERSIPGLKNEEFVVKAINFAKTGTRVAGSGASYGYFDSEWEYEPPTFDCDKTYKILSLSYKDDDQEDRLAHLSLKDEDLRIQADNVVKVQSAYRTMFVNASH